MQLYMVNAEEAVLILHCQLENDRLKYVQSRLEKLKEIIEIELLESRV
jgi:hypothetical protein